MAYKQNLQGAQGGTIQGAHGGTQQLGEAAKRRLGGSMSPGAMKRPDVRPAVAPPVDPSEPVSWKTGGPDGAPGVQTKPMPLPGFQMLSPGALGGGGAPGPGDIPPGMAPTGMHPLNPAAGAPPPAVDLPGRPGMFDPGVMRGVGNAVDQMQQHGGAPGGDPLPGFAAAPGMMGATGGPLMSLPGPSGKFPPRPGLPTKPLPVPPGAPQTRPGFGGGGGGLSPTGPRPRNNMASY